MATVFLGLGTNLGDKEQNLYQAVQEIEKRIGKVTSLSAFYVTDPWGFDSKNTFLNAACCVVTEMPPLEVLRKTKEIEQEMGRAGKSVNKVYSDRVIDIDLLLYDDLIMDSGELVLPHPLMAQRDFVMQPLSQIAPDIKHPVLGQTMKELNDSVIKLGDI